MRQLKVEVATDLALNAPVKGKNLPAAKKSEKASSFEEAVKKAKSEETNKEAGAKEKKGTTLKKKKSENEKKGNIKEERLNSVSIICQSSLGKAQKKTDAKTEKQEEKSLSFAASKIENSKSEKGKKIFDSVKKEKTAGEKEISEKVSLSFATKNERMENEKKDTLSERGKILQKKTKKADAKEKMRSKNEEELSFTEERNESKEKSVYSELKLVVEDLREKRDEKEQDEGSHKISKAQNALQKEEKGTVSTIEGISVGVAKELKEGGGKTFAEKIENLLKADVRKEAAKAVESTKITLFNGERGEIRMVLHPETLGNVKINLKLNENVIDTYVSVSSKEAYKAFSDLGGSTLKQAFTDGGFEVGAFNVLLDGRASADSFFQKGQNDSADFQKALNYAEGKVEESGENFERNVFSANNFINIVA